MFNITDIFLLSFKVIEDLSYVVQLRKQFNYIESIPGVLLPHPSSSAYPIKIDGYGGAPEGYWQHYPPSGMTTTIAPPPEFFNNHHQQTMAMKITPSMSSLEALLSKLPSVVPPEVSAAGYCESQSQIFLSSPQRAAVEYMGSLAEKVVAKEEIDEEYNYRGEEDNTMGESSSSISAYRRQQHHYHHHQDLSM